MPDPCGGTAAVDGAGEKIVEAVEDQLAAMSGIDEAVDEGAPPLVASLETMPAFDEGDIAEELIVGVDAAARVAGSGADGAVSRSRAIVGNPRSREVKPVAACSGQRRCWD